MPKALSRRERRQLKEKAKAENLWEPLTRSLASGSTQQRLEAAKELNSLLSGSLGEAFEKASEELVPWLLELAADACEEELRSQCLFALQRLSERAPTALGASAMARLAPLLKDETSSVREQAMTILSNVARTSQDMRDMILASGGVNFVMSMFQGGQSPQPVPVVRKAALLLHAVCCWPPSQEMGDAVMKRLLHTLSLLTMSNDEGVIVESCRALSCLEHRSPHNLAVLLVSGVFERLVFLFAQPSSEVCTVSVSAARAIACGSETGLQALLLQEPIPVLKDILAAEDASCAQREACALLTAILTLGGPHVEEVVAAGCVPLFVRLLTADAEEGGEVQLAAARAVGALSRKCTRPEQMADLLVAECVSGMVSLLQPSSISWASLDFVEKALPSAEMLGTTRFAALLKEAGAPEKLKEISEKCSDERLKSKAERIFKLLC